MKNLAGKKLLLIGGAFQHRKVVEAAKALGVTVYVTDYLPVEKAPAKEIADKYYMHNITDIDEIVEMCREEKIDGVLATHLDACQLPYQQVCERLGLPCFGSAEQFRYLTDKKYFKKICIENNVDVIPSYTPADFESEEICAERVAFPILIKPGMSRGSRGQTICYSYDEVQEAIRFARSESGTGEVVIERYMGSNNDFSITALVINGAIYLERTCDRVLGAVEDHMDKSAIASINPSVYTALYEEKVHQKVVKLIEAIGLKNAPVFMQGFVDGDTVRFYDPGLRFPGIDYERNVVGVYGKNPINAYIEYALTGEITDDYSWLSDSVRLDGKAAIALFIPIRPGKIVSISGIEEISSHPAVTAYFQKYHVGDEIGAYYNVNQRFCEIDLLCESKKEMANVIDWIYATLKIVDAQGESMVISKLNTDCLRQAEEV